jgi:hypothetical protein
MTARRWRAAGAREGEKGKGSNMNRLGAISAILASAAVLGLSGGALAATPKLFISGDMVISPPEGAAGPHCVLASQFKHGDEVVFRVRVLSPSGDAVTDKDIKTLTVDLSSGQTIAMRYGGHPHDKPLDNFWSAAWKIPADFPSGSMSYKVVATLPDGSTQDWAPFNVAPSQLTVLPGDAD